MYLHEDCKHGRKRGQTCPSCGVYPDEGLESYSDDELIDELRRRGIPVYIQCEHENVP